MDSDLTKPGSTCSGILAPLLYITSDSTTMTLVITITGYMSAALNSPLRKHPTSKITTMLNPMKVVYLDPTLRLSHSFFLIRAHLVTSTLDPEQHVCCGPAIPLYVLC
ncbi:hypothetical protein [Paenibacillus silvae]|uniref:hypothetical protein n=1 Tax=Paenibacillus silvae TaxID=1325358 RepID=UPI0016431B4C|nr:MULTISPECIES: hypothetical protein [Paenibacillus]